MTIAAHSDSPASLATAAPRRSRRTAFKATSVAAAACIALTVSSCAGIPGYPPALDTDYVPTVSASPTFDLGALSPYGFSEAQRMTVRVRNIGCSGLSTGTGFAIDSNTLVTNRHVVENSKDIEVTTYDGHTIDVTTASVTTVADLAIVTTNEAIGVFSVLAQDDPVEGDAITVVGYPHGGQLTTTSGIVLGETKDPLGASVGTVLATTAQVEPGSSGSPVLNEEGAVVGVIYAKNESEQSFMVPVSTLRELIDQESLLVPQPNACPTAPVGG